MNILITLSNTIEKVTPGVVTADISWASDLLALLGIFGVIGTGVAFWVRREVKQSLNEIKTEFKPNGGGSLKDQVNRLEQKHQELDEKVDTMENSINRMGGKLDTVLSFILGKKDSK